MANDLQIIHVGPGVMDDFETGATLETILMFPKREQVAERQPTFLALCAAFAAEQVRSVPDYAEYGSRYSPGCPDAAHAHHGAQRSAMALVSLI